MVRFSFRSSLNRSSTGQRIQNRQWTFRTIERLEERLVLSSYSVTSTLDTVDANPGDGLAADVDGNATLRAAVIDANALAGADTITLGTGVFALSIGGRNENAAATGDLDIVGDLTIEGAGADQTILDAAQLDRFFHVAAGSSLTLRNLTIQNGSESNGGAIANLGTLLLENVNLTSNATTLRGGAISNDSGDVTLQSVNFSDNQTRDVTAGGGNSIGGALSSFGGTVTVTSSQFVNNSAAAEGGAIDARGTILQVTDSSFSDNTATVGGAVRLFNGTATFTNDTSSGDHAIVSGGAIASNYCTLTISGGSFTGNSLSPIPPTGAVRTGGSLYLVGINPTSTVVTITGVTFEQTGSGDGGAIYNSNGRINLSNSTFDHVTGGQGGAIWNSNGGFLFLWNTTFVNNTGILGAAIFNTGQAQMINCTVTGNTSTGVPFDGPAAVYGGASFISMNNLIAGNVGGLDVGGVFTSQGGNLIGQGAGSLGFTQPTDQVGTAGSPIDPLVSPLADNGGPVKTVAISAQSPARDAGVAGGPPTDARGLPRTGKALDIGAYEFQNHVPTAGPFDVTIDEDQVLTGQLPASDADGDPLTYQLLNPATGGTIDVQSNGQFTYTPPANASGTAFFRYRVTDGRSFSTEVDGRIVVVPVNDPPTVADQSFTVAENSEDGHFIGWIVASDIDSSSLSAEIVSGNENGAIGLVGQNGALYVADGSLLNFEANPTFSFVIRITDNGDPTASSLATITISLTDANDPPLVDSPTFTIDENSPNGTVVGTMPVSDEDAQQSYTFEIAIPVPSAFAIDPTTGEITVADETQLNYETNPVSSLLVRVTDNGDPTFVRYGVVTINLNDVNDPPVVADQSYTVDENSPDGTFIGWVQAYDVDNTVITGEIASGNDDGAIGFNGQTGALFVADSSLLDFETNPTLSFVIRITDNGNPAASSLATITIQLSDVNEAPQPQSATFAIDENSAIGSVVGTVEASDVDAGQSLAFEIVNSNLPGAFAIDAATGQITVADASMLNFEAQPSLSLLVRVSDNSSPALSGDAVVVINLNDVNEAPQIGAQSFSISENSANGTLVGTVSASDSDVGQSLTYSIASGNLNGALTIDPASGQISVANSAALNFETSPAFNLMISVTDNGTPALSSSAPVMVSLTDVNERPQLQPQAFSINENAANGAVVGTVAGSDPDAGQSLTYAIVSGNTSGAFSINASTGQIKVANSAALNFESNPAFSLVISATDNGAPALVASAMIAISLNNVNEAPQFDATSFSLNENSPNSTVVGTVTGSDPDAGQSLTYAIVSGNTNGAFAINPVSGQITVLNSAALNFEATPSFSLVVRATDNGTPSLSTNATITIALTDVNEAPQLLAQTFSIAENSANGSAVGTVVASDPDAGQTLTYAILAGNTSGAFAINSSTGKITVANAAALDFEVTPTFSLQVRVSDNGTPSRSSTATVTVSLTDVIETLAVIIDVAPGDSTNTIRVGKKFDVAILSTSTFSAKNIDVGSVRFGKLGTENSLVSNPHSISYSYRDVNQDGRLDLVVQIDADDTGLRIGDTLARLTGKLVNGQSVAGSSPVVVKR